MGLITADIENTNIRESSVFEDSLTGFENIIKGILQPYQDDNTKNIPIVWTTSDNASRDVARKNGEAGEQFFVALQMQSISEPDDGYNKATLREGFVCGRSEDYIDVLSLTTAEVTVTIHITIRDEDQQLKFIQRWLKRDNRVAYKMKVNEGTFVIGMHAALDRSLTPSTLQTGTQEGNYYDFSTTATIRTYMGDIIRKPKIKKLAIRTHILPGSQGFDINIDLQTPSVVNGKTINHTTTLVDTTS